MPPPDLCPNPYFGYDPVTRTYQTCTHCGQLAWSHRGSRPMVDVTNYLNWITAGSPGLPPAPVVVPDPKET